MTRIVAIDDLRLIGVRVCQEDECRSFARWSAVITPTFHKFLCDHHVRWYR